MREKEEDMKERREEEEVMKERGDEQDRKYKENEMYRTSGSL